MLIFYGRRKSVESAVIQLSCSVFIIQSNAWQTAFSFRFTHAVLTLDVLFLGGHVCRWSVP